MREVVKVMSKNEYFCEFEEMMKLVRVKCKVMEGFVEYKF